MGSRRNESEGKRKYPRGGNSECKNADKSMSPALGRRKVKAMRLLADAQSKPNGVTQSQNSNGEEGWPCESAQAKSTLHTGMNFKALKIH
jgi:hypothetical protein